MHKRIECSSALCIGYQIIESIVCVKLLKSNDKMAFVSLHAMENDKRAADIAGYGGVRECGKNRMLKIKSVQTPHDLCVFIFDNVSMDLAKF